MADIQYKPDFIFEVSWEVCNKVGGIHTVLATKAHTLTAAWGDRFLLIGPDLPSHEGANPEFKEDASLFPAWKQYITGQGLRVRSGRWNIPGNPLVILIDFTSLYARKNEIFTDLWVKFRLDSLSGQWDYIEPALFGYAAGMVIAGFYECHINATDKVVAQFHEWLSGAGILYLEERTPQVATVFTTHATVLGRAMASNKMTLTTLSRAETAKKATELGIISKHSLEQIAATTADCFTTVSALTGEECEQLLGVTPDFITSNGFDITLAPPDDQLMVKRQQARRRLLTVAMAMFGEEITDDCLLVLKSGRYEFTNKGIDVFIRSMQQLSDSGGAAKEVIGFIFVPAAHTGPVTALKNALASGISIPDRLPPLTHNLINIPADPVLQLITSIHVNDAPGQKILFAPVYLDGKDGIFDMDYYDLLPGFDLGIFPSYYEPWGYTPLESVAFGVPAITSSSSGFGKAAAARSPGDALVLVERAAGNDREAIEKIAEAIRHYASLSADDARAASSRARDLSRHFTWEQLIGIYYMAYDLSIQKSMQREAMYHQKPQAAAIVMPEHPAPQPVWREVNVAIDVLPALQPLIELAGNLWWSWHRIARELFAYADKICGTCVKDTPHLLPGSLDYQAMQRLLNTPRFMTLLDGVIELYRQEMASAPSGPLVAYFSPEYAIYQPLKIYAGGLGILSGDYLKTVADQHGNMVAIGLLYRSGYFKQQLSPTGEQVVLPDTLQPEQLPLTAVMGKDGTPLIITLPFPGRILHACAWLVKIGGVSLYLIDTQVPQNSTEDARITAQLYPADINVRLQQQLLLGMGGIRLLEALSIQPDVYHINEGHAAFAGLERINQLMRREHLDFDQAVEIVKAACLFTTHTAVPAGIHVYEEEQLRPYLSYLTRELGINWEQLMQLGKAPSDQGAGFSMFFLATRLAQQVNAVSNIHRKVTARLLQPLWPAFRPEELSVITITNGIHFPTWLSAAWPEALLAHAEAVNDMEPATIWEIRLQLKKQLAAALRRRLAKMNYYDNADTVQRRAVDTLDENALYIGFARRFAPYKRADLLFTDTDRLRNLLADSRRPVYLLIAGKAHPNDAQGINLLKKILALSQQKGLSGRVFFLENYDMETAQLLVQGVDLWLNTPRVQEEACGTSGMKVILNGALHCSTLDGWWAEAYQEDAGWAISQDERLGPGNWQEQQDADKLYKLLEQQIIPAFFDRNNLNMPEKWLRMIRKSMTTVLPAFNMKRPAAAYAEQYEHLAKRTADLSNNKYALLNDFVRWKQMMRTSWNELHVFSLHLPDFNNEGCKVGDIFAANLEIYLGALNADDITVEALFTRPGSTEEYFLTGTFMLEPGKGNRRLFSIALPLQHTGASGYTFRVRPKHPQLLRSQDLPLVMWI